VTKTIFPKNASFQEKDARISSIVVRQIFQKTGGKCANHDSTISIPAGIINGNGGVIPDGSWQIRPGPGVTVIEGAGSPCLIEIPETSSGVTLTGISAIGYLGPFGI
jgi:uncharacterized membrane protein